MLSASPHPLTRGEQDLIISKLGATAWVRVLHFTECYGPGWGEGRNEQLSPKGLAAFLLFLQHATFPPANQPSVFLTDMGELELVWEDAQHHSIQLTFGTRGIDLMQEGKPKPSMRNVPHHEATFLAQEISGW